MSAHTPGPWEFRKANYFEDGTVSPAYHGDGYSENPGIFGPDEEMVVGCDEYNVFSGPRQAGNVCLLIAAPDLLAALKACYAALHPYTDEAVAARAAIAKATGGAA